MICLMCRDAELVYGFTSVSFEREKMKLRVNGVPARLCPSCGEAYVEEDTVVRLLQKAADATEMGIMGTAIEYYIL